MGLGALAGAGLVADIWNQERTNDANRDQTRETNASNARESAENRKFQESMSNTAHTREVVDLKRAGLNPLLSVNAGASSPAGSQANAVTGTGAVASAKFAASAQEYARLKQEAKTVDAGVKKAGADTRASDALAGKLAAETRIIKANSAEAETKGGLWTKIKDGLGFFDKKADEAAKTNADKYKKHFSPEAYKARMKGPK